MSTSDRRTNYRADEHEHYIRELLHRVSTLEDKVYRLESDVGRLEYAQPKARRRRRD